MKNKGLVIMVTASLLFGWQTGTWAAGPAQPAVAATKEKQEKQEVVYGWQLMSPEERTAYRAKMHSLTTEKEREQYRREHHKLMQKRAKERGVTLPAEPGPMGKAMGPGVGMGRGR